MRSRLVELNISAKLRVGICRNSYRRRGRLDGHGFSIILGPCLGCIYGGLRGLGLPHFEALAWIYMIKQSTFQM